jgi:hypothetical protein
MKGYNSFFCRGKVWNDRKIKRGTLQCLQLFVKKIVAWSKPEQILYSALAFVILLQIFLLILILFYWKISPEIFAT